MDRLVLKNARKISDKSILMFLLHGKNYVSPLQHVCRNTLFSVTAGSRRFHRQAGMIAPNLFCCWAAPLIPATDKKNIHSCLKSHPWLSVIAEPWLSEDIQYLAEPHAPILLNGCTAFSSFSHKGNHCPQNHCRGSSFAYLVQAAKLGFECYPFFLPQL